MASHQLPERPEVLVEEELLVLVDPEIHPQRHHHKEILEGADGAHPFMEEAAAVALGVAVVTVQALLVVMADLDLLAVLAVLQLLMLVEVVEELMEVELQELVVLVVVVMASLLGLRHKMELPTSVAVEAAGA